MEKTKSRKRSTSKSDKIGRKSSVDKATDMKHRARINPHNIDNVSKALVVLTDLLGWYIRAPHDSDSIYWKVR